jgi:hypothetical protein
LNALKHENVTKQKNLEELQTRYDQMVKDADESVKTDAGESETAVVSYALYKLLILKTMFFICSLIQNIF